METAKNMLADKGREIVSVPVGTTLFATLEKMNQNKVIKYLYRFSLHLPHANLVQPQAVPDCYCTKR